MMQKLLWMSALFLSLAMSAVLPAADAPPSEFELRPVGNGPVFRSAEARGRYVALHFLLKTECPYCLMHTRSYELGAPTVAGVVHVFIKPDAEADIAKWVEKQDSPAPFPIYRDPEAALAKAFAIPDGYAFHGETVHYPALVLLDPRGTEVFRHVGKSNADRLSFDKFAAKMAELTRPAEAADYNLEDDSTLCLQGYDPVAYFVQSKAAKGSDDFVSHYGGHEYRFATAENRVLFNTDPQRYLPAYGGWCATAMAEGNKVAIDPENFKVTDGRLFLFYNGWLGDAKKPWVKDEANLRQSADEHWKKVGTAKP